MPFLQKKFIHVQPTDIPLEKGKLLVSAPFMTDGYFDRTVILLVEQDSHGSLGFILNRPLHVYLDDVVETLTDRRFILYNGGPVSLDKLFFIHTYGELISQSEPIGNGLYLGGSEKDMQSLHSEGLLDADHIRYYVGYASWAPGQLERELSEKAWVVSDFQENCVFASDKSLWRSVVNGLGRPYHAWLDIPDKAYYN